MRAPRILIERSKLAPSHLPRVYDRARFFLALTRIFVGDFCVHLGKLDVELRLDAPGFSLAFSRWEWSEESGAPGIAWRARS